MGLGTLGALATGSEGLGVAVRPYAKFYQLIEQGEICLALQEH